MSQVGAGVLRKNGSGGTGDRFIHELDERLIAKSSVAHRARGSPAHARVNTPGHSELRHHRQLKHARRMSRAAAKSAGMSPPPPRIPSAAEASALVVPLLDGKRQMRYGDVLGRQFSGGAI